MKMLLQLFTVVLLTSCSTSVVSFYVVNENKIELSTFSFYERKTNNLALEQQKFDNQIEQHISEVLISKGYKNQPYSDMYISYKITTGTTSTSRVENNSYNNYSYLPYQNVNTIHYKEGVLLIELFNKQDKLLWQGSKPFKVRKSIDTKELLLEYAKEITSSFKSSL